MLKERVLIKTLMALLLSTLSLELLQRLFTACARRSPGWPSSVLQALSTCTLAGRFWPSWRSWRSRTESWRCSMTRWKDKHGDLDDCFSNIHIFFQIWNLNINCKTFHWRKPSLLTEACTAGYCQSKSSSGRLHPNIYIHKKVATQSTEQFKITVDKSMNNGCGCLISQFSHNCQWG